MENKTISIGTQIIDLDSLRKITDEELKKILETLYFDGYQQALKSLDNKISENIEQLISLKKETANKKEQTETVVKQETPVIEAPKTAEGKIEIKISAAVEEETDPLKKRMNEIADMVYKFPKAGYVIYRYNGTEDEYLRGKYGFSTLPMKALIFDTEEEALKYKEMYWGSGYDELFIRKV
jgi:hypothetical protein